MDTCACVWDQASGVVAPGGDQLLRAEEPSLSWLLLLSYCPIVEGGSRLKPNGNLG